MSSANPNASTTDVLSLAGTKIGNLRLERVIGRGRMGVVYLAHDEALLRPTAVKILAWQLKEQSVQSPEAWFLAEARSVARVNHPNVVQIYGVARQGPHCYIAMEYVHGGSAQTVVAQNGPFVAARATEILVATARALKAAHDAGIVHRDVKPENLLIGSDGTAKLGDFGMALHVSAPRPTGTSRAGTPYYTAPEIWQGQDASPKTDLYALGATYFYLLTGRVPFEANDLPTLIAAHLEAPVPMASKLDAKVPPQCDVIIRQCMAKAARDRFPDCGAVASAAENLLLSLQGDSEPRAKKIGLPSKRPVVGDLEVEGEVSSLEVSSAEVGQRERSDSAICPRYAGEPLQSQEVLLRSWMESPKAHTMVLLGESGTGRTYLARQLMKSLAKKSIALHMDGSKLTTMGASGGSLRQTVEELPREFGKSSDDVERFGVRIARIAQRSNKPGLLVIDEKAHRHNWYERLGGSARTSLLSEYWKVLVIDAARRKEYWEELAKSVPAGEMLTSLLPRLTFEQSLEYVHRCIDVARTTPCCSSGLFVTPDACLLIAHRANGQLNQLRHLLESLVAQARIERTFAVCSWDVWCARLDGAEHEGSESDVPSRMARPDPWPTPSVLEILNQYRLAIGIPPRR